MYTWIFEKVAPEDLPAFTGTTPKPTVYDSEKPRNYTRKKTEGRERVAVFGEKKKCARHTGSDTSTGRYRFPKSR